MAKTVRMADIAQRLGISIVSVSKALAGKSGVSAEMRARIEETAREMGYRPAAARDHAAAGGESIGVLVADRFFNENTFYSSLYRELLRASAKAGVNVMMEIVTPDAERACNVPLFVANRKADGLIFMGEISSRYIAASVRDGTPHVLLDFHTDTLTAGCVVSDNIIGGYQLTRHLLEQGYQRIAFVGSIHATSSIMDRYLGYTKALLRAGMEPRADWRIEDRDADGLYLPLEIPEDRPDAYVCSCDEVAQHLVEMLQGEGVNVPHDVAVAGYDDFRFSVSCRPPLTSYRVDVPAMAAAAVTQLMRQIANGHTEAATVTVPGSLVVRESTQA